MTDMHLIFRSGAEAVVTVDDVSVEVVEDPETQELTRLSWAGPVGPGELRYVDPAELAAVIVRVE